MALYQGISSQAPQRLAEGSLQDGGLITVGIDDSIDGDHHRVGYVWVMVYYDNGLEYRVAHAQPIWRPGISLNLNLTGQNPSGGFAVDAVWNYSGMDWRVSA